MPRFEPFAALRYAPGTDLDAVIAPPYDVLSDIDVDALQARDAHNIVHVDVPRGGPQRYTAAARRLQDWIAEGVLVADEQPSFTVYRMGFTDESGVRRAVAGVFGALEVVDVDAGGVLPHERTTKKASTDRLDLTRATGCNLSPVWGLALASGLTAELQEPGEPMGSLQVDGVEHSVERIVDPQRVARISAAVGADDVLIADGHHRYGISRIYRDEQRGTPLAAAAELTLAFVQELTPEQLSIDAIHRLYTGVTHEQVRADLSECFDLAPAPRPDAELLQKMRQRGALALVGPDGSAHYLIPKPRAFDGVRSLDGAWLEHALANSAAQVSYQHGVPEVLEALRGGAAQAAVLIRPTSITEIERTAREGLLMPPKSTFFTPKLRTGLVIRDLRLG
ncbi:MAG: DUF1015 domain-containing protein [Austwickia sp.]|jgi:uncharacterized protein (DUF1015 family)|nr:DUF1015 domain-containing protein [Austwickia sp.]MBK8435370.1 DUF1015 domain-containing protein [Austwickia sp.]MBK9101083.1 DUF1015 domain-containing protein [Austwickia sp.]